MIKLPKRRSETPRPGIHFADWWAATRNNDSNKVFDEASKSKSNIPEQSKESSCSSFLPMMPSTQASTPYNTEDTAKAINSVNQKVPPGLQQQKVPSLMSQTFLPHSTQGSTSSKTEDATKTINSVNQKLPPGLQQQKIPSLMSQTLLPPHSTQGSTFSKTEDATKTINSVNQKLPPGLQQQKIPSLMSQTLLPPHSAQGSTSSKTEDASKTINSVKQKLPPGLQQQKGPSLLPSPQISSSSNTEETVKTINSMNQKLPYGLQQQKVPNLRSFYPPPGYPGQFIPSFPFGILPLPGIAGGANINVPFQNHSFPPNIIFNQISINNGLAYQNLLNLNQAPNFANFHNSLLRPSGVPINSELGNTMCAGNTVSDSVEDKSLDGTKKAESMSYAKVSENVVKPFPDDLKPMKSKIDADIEMKFDEIKEKRFREIPIIFRRRASSIRVGSTRLRKVSLPCRPIHPSMDGWHISENEHIFAEDVKQSLHGSNIASNDLSEKFKTVTEEKPEIHLAKGLESANTGMLKNQRKQVRFKADTNTNFRNCSDGSNVAEEKPKLTVQTKSIDLPTPFLDSTNKTVCSLNKKNVDKSVKDIDFNDAFTQLTSSKSNHDSFASLDIDQFFHDSDINSMSFLSNTSQSIDIKSGPSLLSVGQLFPNLNTNEKDNNFDDKDSSAIFSNDLSKKLSTVSANDETSCVNSSVNSSLEEVIKKVGSEFSNLDKAAKDSNISESFSSESIEKHIVSNTDSIHNHSAVEDVKRDEKSYTEISSDKKDDIKNSNLCSASTDKDSELMHRKDLLQIDTAPVVKKKVNKMLDEVVMHQNKSDVNKHEINDDNCKSQDVVKKHIPSKGISSLNELDDFSDDIAFLSQVTKDTLENFEQSEIQPNINDDASLSNDLSEDFKYRAEKSQVRTEVNSKELIKEANVDSDARIQTKVSDDDKLKTKNGNLLDNTKESKSSKKNENSLLKKEENKSTKKDERLSTETEENKTSKKVEKTSKKKKNVEKKETIVLNTDKIISVGSTFSHTYDENDSSEIWQTCSGKRNRTVTPRMDEINKISEINLKDNDKVKKKSNESKSNETKIKNTNLSKQKKDQSNCTSGYNELIDKFDNLKIDNQKQKVGQSEVRNEADDSKDEDWKCVVGPRNRTYTPKQDEFDFWDTYINSPTKGRSTVVRKGAEAQQSFTPKEREITGCYSPSKARSAVDVVKKGADPQQRFTPKEREITGCNSPSKARSAVDVVKKGADPQQRFTPKERAAQMMKNNNEVLSNKKLPNTNGNWADRSVVFYSGRNNVMYMIRGLPGCGKTTIANMIKQMYPPGDVRIISGGHVRYINLGNGQYEQDQTALTIQKTASLEEARNLYDIGKNVIIVDNIHLQYEDMREYLRLAHINDYIVNIIEPDFGIDVETCFNRNTYHVPKEKLQEMISAYEKVIAYYYGWTISMLDTFDLRGSIYSKIQSHLTDIVAFRHFLFKQNIQKIDNLFHVYHLKASSSCKNNTHVTACYTNCGRRPGSKTYSFKVEHAVGRIDNIQIIGLCLTPQCLFARVLLSEKQKEVWGDDDAQNGENNELYTTCQLQELDDSHSSYVNQKNSNLNKIYSFIQNMEDYLLPDFGVGCTAHITLGIVDGFLPVTSKLHLKKIITAELNERPKHQYTFEKEMMRCYDDNYWVMYFKDSIIVPAMFCGNYYSYRFN